MLEPSINLCGSHLYRFQALTGSLHSGQSFPDTPLARARAGTDAATFKDAWTEGQAMTLGQAVAVALAKTADDHAVEPADQHVKAR
jgi:hypothetical protein